MSINLSTLPNFADAASALPSVSDVGEVVSDVVVTALDTAGEAATVVVATARRQPKLVAGVAIGALLAVLAVWFMRRRATHAPELAPSVEHSPRIVAA